MIIQYGFIVYDRERDIDRSLLTEEITLKAVLVYFIAERRHDDLDRFVDCLIVSLKIHGSFKVLILPVDIALDLLVISSYYILARLIGDT